MIKEYYQITIKEGDKVIKKYHTRRCRSFLKQFAQVMLNVMSQIANAAVKDTTNTSRTAGSQFSMTTLGASGVATTGLVVGSNATAATVSDYGMNTLIAHGVNAGQLQYSAQICGAPSWDATTNYFVFTRVFTNASGGNVLINEIGLYGLATYSFCLMRDTLPATITLANGQNMTLNYTIKATL